MRKYCENVADENKDFPFLIIQSLSPTSKLKTLVEKRKMTKAMRKKVCHWPFLEVTLVLPVVLALTIELIVP